MVCVSRLLEFVINYRMNHELENLFEQETTVTFCRSQRLEWAGNVNKMKTSDKESYKNGFISETTLEED